MRVTVTEASFSMRRNVGLGSTAAMPASAAIAASGSCRRSASSTLSSRSEAKIARGATSTAGARTHQLRRARIATAVQRGSPVPLRRRQSRHLRSL
jgi:hypothetical protein